MTLPAGPGSTPVPAVCLVILDGWGIAPDGPDNAPELMALPDIDGFLVGGASLEAESFAAIVEAARPT